MEDIKSILSQFHAKKSQESLKTVNDSARPPSAAPHSSEIPDMFFSEILSEFKLARIDIAVYLFLYTQVWSKPNLYRSHGIGPLNSYQGMSKELHFTQDEILHSLKALENLSLIESVRAGQYFVRKYFTESNDLKYGQDYDEFF